MAETITAAVGTAPALNRSQDVETIQSLLNQVPANQGGPDPLLDLDGLIGPLTIGAIRNFQKFQLGFNDGRVDPNQQTLAKLNEFDLDPAIGNALQFREFQAKDGFDRAGRLPGAAAWQMVPLHGSKLVRFENGDAVRSATCNNPAIARPLLLGNVVQIFGLAHGTTILKLRDANGRVLARLDVSVKRKRFMRTSFFFVEDNNRRTTRTEADVDDLLRKMNDIWLPQANVEFVKKKVVDPLTFDDDFGDEVLDASALPAANRPRDEWTVIARKRDGGADFNVFFVWELEQDLDPTTDGVEATTGAAEKTALVEDNNGSLDVGEVVAHEAGHNMGLPDTNNPEELMVGNGVSRRKVPQAQVDRVNP